MTHSRGASFTDLSFTGEPDPEHTASEFCYSGGEVAVVFEQERSANC